MKNGWTWPIEIVDLPIKDGDVPSFFLCLPDMNQPFQNSQIPKFQATQGLPGALPGAVPAPRYSYNAPGATVGGPKKSPGWDAKTEKKTSNRRWRCWFLHMFDDNEL